jgi:hypothetical protein
VAGIRLVDLQGFREVARCYTIAPGIVTPEIVPDALGASSFAQRRTRDFGACAPVRFSIIMDIWIL